MKKFPFFHQLDSMDCGPTCVRMVSAWYGRNYSLPTLRQLSGIGKEGVSLLGISEAAEAIGFRTRAIEASLEEIGSAGVGPFIVHWSGNHFVVVYKIRKNRIYIADPAAEKMVYSGKEFLHKWARDNSTEGVALLMEPGTAFFEAGGEHVSGLSWKTLLHYLGSHRALLIQLAAGLLAGISIQASIPFLTQSVVDAGIRALDISFITLLLLAQLVLLAGQVSVEFMRSWILLHIATRLNLSILEDFLAKLMRLPIAFFDSRNIGDIMQRIDDQQRIQTFLTGPAINTLFSAFSFLIFSVIIAFYNLTVFLVFMAGSLLYIAWVLLFLGYRRRLDYKRFDMMSKNSSSLVQLINGMQEIKLNNCETKKIWDWKKIQTGLFKINMMSLTSSQYQQGGGYLIHQVKNFCITFFSATAVIKGRLTLGEMLAIQYIVGQLNGPVEQLITMVQSVQDARISMDRMNEIHIMRDEESVSGSEPVADQVSLYLKDVTYYYPGAGRQPVLENIDAVIPVGKTTAVVGMSGSGKTTLLKLLLKFYAPAQGRIQLGKEDLQDVSSRGWRARCGVVLQDSYVFSDSIARNIAPAEEEYDIDRIWQAVEIANIREFVESLPAGLDTKIGVEGDGISQGQRQRILIARAVYKDPAFIFFDEATNALDTNNEKIIQQNLDSFFKGRTVIVAAHRLSTVKRADQILVMHKGKIVERGRHEELMAREGMYHQLVKDQF